MFLPIVCCDLAADETYIAADGAAVDLPIVALRGHDDPAVARDEVAAWACVTSAEFEQMVLPGDHFFLRGSESALIGAVKRTLRRLSRDAV